jgi:ApbE superfamily uncharacterized protein (UPF0280 family)
MLTRSGLYREDFLLKETDCTIVSDHLPALRASRVSIARHRRELEVFIRGNPVFQYALNPLRVDEGPEVAMLMAEASRRCGVGPMAAVAGVLADLAVRDMLEAGASVAVVENGGEASVASDRPINVALRAGETPLSNRVGFRIEGSPIGLATSSGVFSHALSLGEAEAVTVFAENAGVADAAATAICNAVEGEAEREVIELAIKLGLTFEGVKGVLVLFGGHVGMGGEVPSLMKIDPDEVDSRFRMEVG